VEAVWELAVVSDYPSTSSIVIGRLDRPIHDADFIATPQHGPMDHPNKSGDDSKAINGIRGVVL